MAFIVQLFGNSTVNGTSGNDVIKTGLGNNVINAGAGSDTAYAGGGNDLFIHRLGENAGARDFYDGGLGTDTLRLVLTQAEWVRADVQADVAAFLAHQKACLNRILSPIGLTTSFTFRSMGLTVDDIETLEIVVDGVVLDPRDQAVTATADAVSTTEDAGATIDLLANDVVPDRVRSISLLTPSTLGTVSIAPSLAGTTQSALLSFTPGAAMQSLKAGEVRTETLTYEVVDADGDRSTASVTIKVVGVNDAAMIAPDASVPSDNLVTEAGSGTAGDASASGKLKVTDVDAGESAFQTPASLAGSYGTFAFNAQTGAWSYVLDQAAANSLAAGQTVEDKLTVKSLDGTATYDIVVNVKGTNDAPVVTGVVSGSATEDGAAPTLDALANSSDVDLNTTLSVVNVPATLPAGVSYNAATHSFSLDPTNAAYQSLAANETLDVVVSYGVSDGMATTPASIKWTVTGTNDAPVVTGVVSGSATEDGAAVTLDALANASDVDHNTTLSVVNVPATLPAGVSYNAATHSFSLDPSASAYQSLADGETLDVEVSYGVTDGTATTSALVKWTITGTNDAPVVTGAVSGSATEDGAAVTLDALANASDVDHNMTLSVVNVPATLPAGVSYDAATHTFSLDPSASAYQSLADGETLDVEVSYSVTDGTATAPASVKWTITGTNDAPVVTGAVTGAADARAAVSTLDALAGASDIDSTTLTVVDVPATLPAGVSYDAATHTFSLDPSNAVYTALPSGQQTIVSVSYGISDGLATTPQTVSWTVTGTNHAPEVVANSPSSFTSAAGNLNTDAAFDLDLSTIFTDVDGDQLTYTIDSLPQGFSLANGHIVQTSAASPASAGDYTVAVTAKDGNGGEVTKDLSITVALENNYGTFVQNATINASSANDTIKFGVYAGSGGGSVTANGGDGNDTIEFGNNAGGLGSATANGGDGNDTINFGTNAAPSGGKVTVDAGDGSDKISFGTDAGTGGTLSIDLGANDGDADTVTFDGSVKATITSFEVGTDKLDLNVNANTLATAESGNNLHITGNGIDIWVNGIGPGHTLAELLVDKPWSALIGSPTNTFVIEDENVTNNQLTATGTISIRDINAGEAGFEAGLAAAGPSTWGTLTLAADGSYTYIVDSNDARVQKLRTGEVHNELFTVTALDGTTKDVNFFIIGTNDTALIGDPTNAAVTEDLGVNGAGQLLATGQLSISDADAGEALFNVSYGSGNWGTLTLAPDGSYTYAVSNSDSRVQALNANQTHTDTFTVMAVDGTTKQVSFTINGADDNVDAVITTAAAKLDIIAPNYSGTGGVQISLGSGDGTFSVGQTVTTGGDGHIGTALRDINGDGIADLAVGNLDGSLQVSLGNGDGSFQDAATLSLSSSGVVDAISLVDVNKDGAVDIVAAVSSSVYVALGDGTGSFGSASKVNVGGSDHRAVAVADLNNDGNVDIITTNQSSPNGFQMSLGNGDGTFQTGKSFTTGGSGHFAVAVGDLDNDGNFDVVVTSTGSPLGAIVRLGNGDGSFDAATTVAVPVGFSPIDVALGDVNGDGNLDIVVANHTSANGASVSLGNGDGTFKTAQAVATGGGARSSVALADVNGDGKLDIISADYSGQTTARVSFGNGDGTFQAGTTIDLGGGDHYSVLVGEVNAASDRGYVAEDGASSISNTLVFSDGNTADTHTVSTAYAGSGTARGTLTAVVSKDTTGTGTGGEITWTYTPDQTKLQSLAAGEKATETWDVALNDGTSTVHKTLTITLTGVNDAPVAANDVAQVNENSVLTVTAANGLLANDLDVDGTPGLQVVSRPNLGSSTADTDGDGIKDNVDNSPLVKNSNQLDGDADGVGDASDPNPFIVGDAREVAVTVGVAQQLADGSTLTVNADGSYTFDPTGSSKFQSLAAGEQATETFYYVVQDAAGATSAAKATITVIGVNDAPTIVNSTTVNGFVIPTITTGGVIEDQPATYVNNGSIAFTDVDLNDTHTMSFTNKSGTSYGSFSINTPFEPAGAAGGYATWQYIVDGSKIQSVGQGQTAQEIFTVKVDDGRGGFVTQDVTITINGANDAPVYTGPNVLVGGAAGNLATTADKNSINVKSLFSDPDGDAITIAPMNLPALFSGSDIVTAAWSGVLPASSAGDSALTITASDGKGGVTTQQATLSVALKNNFGNNYGQSTAKTVDGSSADDTIVFGAYAGVDKGGLVVANGGGGNDTITFGNQAGFNTARAVANGGSGNDIISFGDYAAYLNGGSVAVDAGSGADQVKFGQIIANSGAITIDLGGADHAQDVVTFAGSIKSSTTISGFEVGTDKIDLNVNANTLATAESGNNLHITGNGIDIWVNGIGPGHTLAELLVEESWAAVIGTPTAAFVTEDANVTNGKLTATGTISIRDINTGEAAFSTSVASAAGNLGALTLAADGSYTYEVDNAAVQYLGAGKSKVDTFTVTSLDGTTKDVSFTINGVNDAFVITNFTYGASNGVLSGLIEFSDADFSDAHTLTQTEATLFLDVPSESDTVQIPLNIPLQWSASENTPTNGTGQIAFQNELGSIYNYADPITQAATAAIWYFGAEFSDGYQSTALTYYVYDENPI